MSAIRKHLVDAIAIVALVAVAAVVATVILANQRLTLPGWVPAIGQDSRTFEAALSSAQAVTPGQGQSVNVAGVAVGEITDVRLEGGRAILTLRIDDPGIPVFRDASVLLRPKTGLRDMVAELTPGTRAAGRLGEGGRIPIGQTLPDVNLDEILAALDDDTRGYVRMLLADGAAGLRDSRRALANTIRRFEPTARDLRRVNAALAERRRNLARVIHNLSLLTGELGRRDDQLATFVDASNAVFSSFARQDRNLRAALRELPSALATTRGALGRAEALGAELGPTLSALRPAARALAPSLRRTRPFLARTRPVIREQIRPFVRATLPTVRTLRPAARDLAAAAPDLTGTLGVLNALLDTLAFNPRGREEGYLFWLSWANHLNNALFSNADAHGPVRRGVVVVSCQTLQILENVVLGNPQLGVLTQLLDAPRREEVC